MSSDKMENGAELWRSDGTQNGTFMIKDLRQGGSPYSGCCGSHPTIVPTGDTLYFEGWNSTEAGWRLYQTDGTPEGTVQVEDPNNVLRKSPQTADYTYMGNSLFFRGSCEYPCSGTELFKIGNITPLSTPGSKPSYTVYTNDEMDPITFNYDESLFQGSIENPTWTTATLGSTNYAENHHVADIDGDGDMDVVSGINNDNIVWWENDGNTEPSWSANYIPHNLDTCLLYTSPSPRDPL